MQNTKTQKKKPAPKVLSKKTTTAAAVKKSAVVKKKATSRKVISRASSKGLKSNGLNRRATHAKATGKKKDKPVKILRVLALFAILVATIVIFVKAFATKLEAPQKPIEKTQESVTKELPKPQSPPSVKNEGGLYRNEQMGIQFKYPEEKILVDDGITAEEEKDGPELNIGTGMIYRDIPNKLFPSANLSEYMKDWDSSAVTRVEGDKQWFCTVLKGEKTGKQCYTQLGNTVYQFDYYQGNNDLFTEEEFNEILKSVDIIG